MTSTRTRLAALALLAVATLSGCGGLHPGVAAEVGDESITAADVDQQSQDACDFLVSDPNLLQGRVLSRSAIMQSVVGSFVLRAVADQLGDEYDVDVADLDSKVTEQVRLQFESLDPDLVERVLPALSGNAYFSSVVTAVGRKELGASGTKPNNDAALKKGLEVARAWETKHGGFTINPRFGGMSVSDDVQQLLDYSPDQTSHAVDDFAKQAAADQPSDEFVKSLPPSQRCGG